MKKKILSMAVIAGCALVGTQAANACAFTAWGSGLTAGAGTVASVGVATNSSGTPSTASLVAGEPGTDTDPTATVDRVKRYYGRCGSYSRASGNYVQDGSPNVETTYRARFYVYTGVTGSAAQVFRANNSGGSQMIGVSYDPAGNFTFNTTSGSGTVPSIVANRWYSVELNWAAATPTMSVTVQGAGATLASTASISGVGTGDRIDVVQLGWITGGTGGSVYTDAFESKRSTPIGRLCRGDANASNTLNVLDRGAITGELTGASVNNGQADCDENGVLNVLDRGCVTGRITATGGTCG